MSWVNPKGSPSAPIWVLVEKPLHDDPDKGFLYSGSQGWVWDKMMREAGIEDYYVTCYRPDTEEPTGFKNIDGELNQYKPPVIIPLGHCGQRLCSELIAAEPKGKRKPTTILNAFDSNIQRYAGSPLTSPRLTYPHVIIPTLEPIDIIKQWKLRDIVISCDLAKAANEIKHWRTHGSLQPLPERIPKIHFSDFDELRSILLGFLDCEYISNDIETVYPRPPTKTIPSPFYKILPGYPITVGLAPSSSFGISFELFRESVTETRELWKTLAKVLWEVPSIGQNFFNFDAYFYEMLGFRLPLEKCRDTMIMHHILWPELPHKLEFLARQYIREPFWKFEGQGWSPKFMDKMKIYNCKDVMCTLEIYYEMLAEATSRGIQF